MYDISCFLLQVLYLRAECFYLRADSAIPEC